jgi:hypothetical protein
MLSQEPFAIADAALKIMPQGAQRRRAAVRRVIRPLEQQIPKITSPTIRTLVTVCRHAMIR